jgi:hypothetical protein
MPHVKLTDDCPCQSGKIFEHCCAKYNFKPLYAVTRTSGLKTGIKNPRCYAAAFEDCSEKISREHFLSNGILKILNENGGLAVAGFPWLKIGVHKQITPANLVGNVLCERHNNALSPLDKVAIRFFKTFRQIEQEFVDEKTAEIERVFLFNGHDLERWMLKTLCGIVYSNNASTLEEKITNWSPKITWLNMLFGIQKFQFGCGIYYEAKIGEKRDLYQGVDFAPLLDQDNIVAGGIINLKEHSFILVMLSPPQEKSGTILEHSVYRPTELVIKKGKESMMKVVVLAWDPPFNKASIEITLTL